MKTIGLVGLGLLGSALADRLLSRGWSVSGFDIDEERRKVLASAGGTPLENLSDVSAFDLLMLSLPTSTIVDDVISSLIGDLRAGQTIVDTTTGHPRDVESIAAKLRNRDIQYVDATIGGSSEQARNGQAIVMCGGDTDAFALCGALFHDLAARTFHLGTAGSGSKMKLAVNLVLGLNRAVLAEGLSFAERLGLDPAATLEVLRAGPANSQVMETKGRKMLQSDFEPQARLAQHLKDVHLILRTGLDVNAVLPLSQVHQELLEALTADGCGDLDNSAIIQAFREQE